MEKVGRSMSTKTGVAPQCSTALAVAVKVKAGRKTRLRGPMLWESRERCRAVVHEEVAMA